MAAEFVFDVFDPGPPLPPEPCSYCGKLSQDATYTGVCAECYAEALAEYEKEVNRGVLSGCHPFPRR